MSEVCCIPGCENQFEKANNDVKFHSFPKNKRILKKWTEFSDLTNKAKIKKARICQLHFKPSDLVTPRLEPGELIQDISKVLKPSAVPTIKPVVKESKTAEQNQVKESSMQKQPQITKKKLGRICIVPGCRSNRKGNIQTGAYPTFRFPTSDPLRKEWLQKIGKPAGYEPGRYSVVCIKHFKKEALLQNFMVDGKETNTPRSLVTLRPGTIPTEFPGIDHRIYTNSSKNVNSICAVNKCESHLREKPLPLFPIPKEPSLRANWIKAIPSRGNWKYNSNMKICSDHFLPSDFVRSSRKQSHPILEENAIPSIFPEDKKPAKRKLTAEEKRSIQIEKEREEKAKFYYEDLVSNFEKLTANYQNRLSKRILGVFRARITNTYITFYQIFFEGGVPSIKTALTVTDRMDIKVTMNNEIVDPKNFESILSHGVKLIKFTELEGLLKMIADGFEPTLKTQVTYKAAVNMLKKAFDEMIDESDNFVDEDSNELQRMLYHVYDHINALLGQTRYSIEMLVQAAKFLCMGHSLYFLVRSLVKYPSTAIFRTYMATDENHRAMNSKKYPNVID